MIIQWNAVWSRLELHIWAQLSQMFLKVEVCDIFYVKIWSQKDSVFKYFSHNNEGKYDYLWYVIVIILIVVGVH